MPRPTTRLNVLPPYPLAHIPQKKRDLIARGVDVIDLGAGDADLPPPPAAVEALAKAAHDPALGRYGFGLGYVPFREAISRWMERRFKQRFDPMTEIVPLIGSKEGIAHLAFGFLQPGDVAIVPEPGYMAYAGGTLLSDAQVYAYALRPRTNFLVDLDDVPKDVHGSHARPVPQLSEQPDRRHRAERIPRGRRQALPGARHPARVRQRVFGDGVRRLRAAVHLRDRRRARRRD